RIDGYFIVRSRVLLPIYSSLLAVTSLSLFRRISEGSLKDATYSGAMLGLLDYSCRAYIIDVLAIASKPGGMELVLLIIY
ncbi:hypothetical protein BJ546DRAFT_1011340, partial [Cryomyces antarcticus]